MGSYQFDISMMMADQRAFQQQLGLSLVLGGSMELARAMGPNEDVLVAMGLTEPELIMNVLLCQECVLSSPITVGRLLALSEHKNDEDDDADTG